MTMSESANVTLKHSRRCEELPWTERNEIGCEMATQDQCPKSGRFQVPGRDENQDEDLALEKFTSFR